MKFMHLVEVFDENYRGFFVEFLNDAKKCENGSKVPPYLYRHGLVIGQCG